MTNTVDRWYNSAMKPEELRKWREASGYTQGELGKILGVALFSISRWENGRREIPSFLHLALQAIPKKGGRLIMAQKEKSPRSILKDLKQEKSPKAILEKLKQEKSLRSILEKAKQEKLLGAKVKK